VKAPKVAPILEFRPPGFDDEFLHNLLMKIIAKPQLARAVGANRA
jgi:hypothetical protein